MNHNINFRLVSKILSKNLFIISVAFLICAGVAPFFSEETLPFLQATFISTFLGFILLYASKSDKEHLTLQKKDAYLTVTLSWALITIIGCLPYLFSGSIPYFIDAYFESVSGFTTTGSSILTDIEILPKSILFWRSLTHWIGGIGIIVLVILVLPAFHAGGYQLFTMESSLQEKIHPKIKSVGFRILMIYLILTLAETVLLMLGKMNLFESVCHAFGTVATGGFSPRNTSIANYSPYIQYVIMIFMLLSGVNFVTYYFLFSREFKKVNKNEEVKFYLIVVLIIGVIITSVLFVSMQKPFEESFREAFFQVISIVTCTGYATADYLIWPQYAWLTIFFAMFLGGCTGSTAGGIKMVRHLVVLKNLRRNFQQFSYPNAVINLRLNDKPLNDETNHLILTFISIYILVFIFGSFLLIALGIDGKTASSSVATCMAGIGPGIGTVGPANNFAHLPGLGKLILSFLMITGRLEIYSVLILFTKRFWME